MINATDHDIISSFFVSVAKKQVTLAIQPIVHCTSFTRVLYEESLLRFHGLINPSSPLLVIRALERTETIQRLDCMVVGAALRALNADSSLRLGCNISASTLAKGPHWKILLDQLNSREDFVSRLTLEITETAFLKDFNEAVANGKLLQAMGCRIALDDFGVGKDRIEFAHALSPDIIKIDASFLWSARASEEALRKLWALTTLSQSISSDVVIEGVEDEADIRIATQAGLQWFQGFGIAYPIEHSPEIVVQEI